MTDKLPENSFKDFTIAEVKWETHRGSLEDLRYQVFQIEQGVSREDEWDGQDESAHHFLVWSSKEDAIATGRLLPSGQVGRMAVLPEYRGRGIGRALLEYMIESEPARQQPRLFLHSQIEAIDFYRQSGFHCVGDYFEEAGILHRTMELSHDGNRV